MKIILITGASSGIGKAIGELLHHKGFTVYGTSRNPEKVANSLFPLLRLDVRDNASIEHAIAEVIKISGRIDVLVNNAGIALPTQLVTDTTLADWRRVMDTNVTGMFLITNAVLPEMVSHKRGAIVNLSSMWGVTGGSCEVAYSASKAAVIGYTKSLAKEVAPSGIRVNCIAPGFILTDMTRCFSEDAIAGICEETPLLRAGTPADVAGAAVFLASEDASFITGQVLSVDGGRCI